jgi:arginine decarboxylase
MERLWRRVAAWPALRCSALRLVFFCVAVRVEMARQRVVQRAATARANRERKVRLMFPIPQCVFLTRGVGVHRHQLTAFEYALRDADIEQQNLVSVSSILPPGCELIPADAGIPNLQPGEITFCVMARAETSEPGRRISASIGLARPKNPAVYGYISEHHGFGMTEQQSGEYAEDLAATMLASTLGIEFDPDAAWNERKRVYEMSDLMVDSMSITAASQGAEDGNWTCVVAAAVFRFLKPETWQR